MKFSGVISRVPLRIGFAGGGTDVDPYCSMYGGFVLNGSINKYVWCHITIFNAGEICFESIDLGVSWHGNLESLVGMPEDLQIHAAVLKKFLSLIGNSAKFNIKISTEAEAPKGSGLGTSSTVVVAIVKALGEYFELALGQHDIALMAYEIERNQLNLAGGRQDQYAATFGGFNFMEFYKDKTVINPLTLHENFKIFLSRAIVLYFTGVSRESADIIINQKKNILNANQEALSATHELKSQAGAMKNCFLKSDFYGFCRILNESWESKKNISQNISNNYLEQISSTVLKKGAKALKISGAGGGGFMMIVVEPKNRSKVIKALEIFDGFVMPFEFENLGASSWRI